MAVNRIGLVSNSVAIAGGRPKATRNQQRLCWQGLAKIDLARVVSKRVLYGEPACIKKPTGTAGKDVIANENFLAYELVRRLRMATAAKPNKDHTRNDPGSGTAAVADASNATSAHPTKLELL